MPSTLKTSVIPDRFQSVLKETEKHSLSTLKLLAHLVEETSDFLTAADINYRPITWNKAAEKNLGAKS